MKRSCLGQLETILYDIIISRLAKPINTHTLAHQQPTLRKPLIYTASTAQQHPSLFPSQSFKLSQTHSTVPMALWGLLAK